MVSNMTEMTMEPQRFAEMAQYLRGDPMQVSRYWDVAVVFGRCSEQLAETARHIADTSLYTFVTGGVGKDSGNLPDMGLTEAEYLGGNLHAETRNLRMDPTARSGLQNAAHAVDAMRDWSANRNLLWVDNVVGVTHPVQSRRLIGALSWAIHDAIGADGRVPEIDSRMSGYREDLTSPFDQFEIANEIDLIELYANADDPRVRIDELPTPEMLEYARAAKAQLAAQFKAQGIRNPSTADNTDRRRSVPRLMLLSTPGVPALRRPLAIARNARDIRAAQQEIAAATRRTEQ